MVERKKISIEKNPSAEELNEEALEEDDEGIASMFGKLLSKKLKGQSKKKFAEVE